MEMDILDSLDDLGYPAASKEGFDDIFAELMRVGPKSIEFTELVSWLSKELQTLCKLDSCVNAITDPDDSSSFLMEVSSLLKELQCPYKSLLSGTISQRLSDEQSRRTFIDYLCTEIQAALITHHGAEKKNFLEIEVDSSSTAEILTAVQEILSIDTDTEENPLSIFPKIEEEINDRLSSRLKQALKPALSEPLSEQQWESVNSLYRDFHEDYTNRRELLLTRLDLTIQSFHWQHGSREKDKQLRDSYIRKRHLLRKNSSVEISDILSARQGIFNIEKTSSAELVKHTQSSLYKIRIPEVPDRGGRPKEQRPPVEMPSWSKRQAGGDGGGYRGGRGGGRGGGGGFRGGGNNYFNDRKKFRSEERRRR